ncbi:polyprenyl synthetase family protein [Nocardia sp. alder85J]|uniref:polyprenyl synthetase family protein n=1 Tax=Nocardia sp. alder85J TaxID=2862949 RepID=UPI001CD5C381|nr:polyprenyl synthetase family protein [Nocardia sp. alder85J]MCX4095778.1 polyprenyl synthetase family protein [Nocardia sp. alder85J]
MTTIVSDGRDVGAALRSAVERLDPIMRAPVSYHFGWCDDAGNPVTADGGKSLRPQLTLLAARAAGNDEGAIPGAVAVELVHNFSLLHDDVMDRDRVRRHRPTVWALWGDATAVLAGDALLSLAHEILIDSPSPNATEASRVLAVATRELIRGQAQDMSFELRDDVTVAECVTMAEGKTGALIMASAVVGALLAGAHADVVRAVETYGRNIGIGFQLADDLLGIWGDPEVTGKPVHADLRAGKKSLPVTWTLRHGGAAGRELAEWMKSGECDEESLRAAADLVEAGGGRVWTRAEAERRFTAAATALNHPAIDTGSRAELLELAGRLIHRTA